MPESLLDAEFGAILDGAFERLRLDLLRAAPRSGAAAVAWIDRQNTPDSPELSFRRLKSHFLLIPRFLEIHIRGAADPEFQRDLVYSSLNGFYFARLLDNVADGQSRDDAALLPIAAFFHLNLQTVYSRWFGPGSSFWRHFRQLWIGMADATAFGCGAASFSESDLHCATAGKMAAVKIPAAAVCFRYGREDLLSPWFDFYDAFCCAHELLDDLIDCFSDLAAGRSSFILSEARRNLRAGETMEAFMIRSGIENAYCAISGWLSEAQRRAELLESGLLVEFMRAWKERVESFRNYWQADLKQLARLADAFERSSTEAA